MKDSEQDEEANEHDSIDEIIDQTDGTGSTSTTSKYDGRPRRSSILKKSSDRPVPKSVSFSSIPGEKKVTNGMKYRLVCGLKCRWLILVFDCFYAGIFVS